MSSAPVLHCAQSLLSILADRAGEGLHHQLMQCALQLLYYIAACHAQVFQSNVQPASVLDLGLEFGRLVSKLLHYEF